jgi:hypothetical protein
MRLFVVHDAWGETQTVIVAAPSREYAESMLAESYSGGCSATAARRLMAYCRIYPTRLTRPEIWFVQSPSEKALWHGGGFW